MGTRTYVCVDLKSFYASVECVARGLDPFETNLVVADPERSEKTICLAVSPALKRLGVPGRCRLFEIPKNIEFIIATPRMQKYIDISAQIYGIYLNYISKDDIHVYSIDEVFVDVTDYLDLYKCSAKELGLRMTADVYRETGIRATCGVGTNLYLAKIALDILAKHSPDFVGILDEESYREKLWHHRPITDFWRIGPGIAKRLAKSGMETMYDVAHADRELLYHLFGIDAELIIDHANGIETATIKDIKAYKPSSNSLSNGQVLPRDYTFEEALTIVKEMTDALCLDMVAKSKITDLISLYIGYSGSLHAESESGSVKLSNATNSAQIMVAAVSKLFLRIADPSLTVRRINVTFCNIVEDEYRQMDLFTDIDMLRKEERMQKAVLSIKDKFGKNAVLRGMNLEEESTMIERNNQIGGHKK